MFRPLSKALWVLISFYALLLIVRAVARGDDFLVFYNVARGFWSGKSPYDVAVYGNMLFKYPPWMLPAFLPFSWFPQTIAQAIWGILEALCLVFVVRELRRLRVSDQTLLIVFLMSVGLLINQARAAQLTIFFLAFAFWVRKSASLWFSGVFAFSAKLLTLFPFISEMTTSRFYKRLPGVAVGAIVLSLPLLFRTYSGNVKLLFTDWMTAMFSSGGAAQEGVGIVSFTSREAQGLPSFILRVFELPESESKFVLGAIALSILICAVIGFFLSNWWAWVALTPLVQPLAWFHFYLLALPIAAFTLQKLIDRRHKPLLAVYFFAFLCMTVVTEKTLGHVGLRLEMLSIKSWGVLGILAISRYTEREAAS